MEIKFYELIGVKHFKRFVLWIEAKLLPDVEYRKVANYNLKSKNMTAVKQFKKMLILNGTIHFVFGAYSLVCMVITVLRNSVFSFEMLAFFLCFLLNLYCVLLQRYNWIRITKVLNKYKYKNSKQPIIIKK